jgi:hypothetical protein
MFARLFAILAVVTASINATRADEKLKGQAADAMKKAEVADARVVETAHLVVAATAPEEKLKPLAEGLEKIYVQAAKALKLEAADTKLQVTVFLFANLDNYRQFQRAVLKQRPDDDQFASYDVKRDDPYIAVSARRSEKMPNFETLAGNEICRALLVKKGGNAKLPEWMKDGFAKAVVWRLNPSTAAPERSTVSRIAPALKKGAKGAMPIADKAWSGTGRDKDLVAASLMDFFTSGSGAEKFGNVLNSMIPSDTAPMPTFADALKAADWMVEDLDRGWREWVAKGSPAAAK